MSVQPQWPREQAKSEHQQEQKEQEQKEQQEEEEGEKKVTSPTPAPIPAEKETENVKKNNNNNNKRNWSFGASGGGLRSCASTAVFLLAAMQTECSEHSSTSSTSSSSSSSSSSPPRRLRRRRRCLYEQFHRIAGISGSSWCLASFASGILQKINASTSIDELLDLLQVSGIVSCGDKTSQERASKLSKHFAFYYLPNNRIGKVIENTIVSPFAQRLATNFGDVSVMSLTEDNVLEKYRLYLAQRLVIDDDADFSQTPNRKIPCCYSTSSTSSSSSPTSLSSPSSSSSSTSAASSSSSPGETKTEKKPEQEQEGEKERKKQGKKEEKGKEEEEEEEEEEEQETPELLMVCLASESAASPSDETYYLSFSLTAPHDVHAVKITALRAREQQRVLPLETMTLPRIASCSGSAFAANFNQVSDHLHISSNTGSWMEYFFGKQNMISETTRAPLLGIATLDVAKFVFQNEQGSEKNLTLRDAGLETNLPFVFLDSSDVAFVLDNGSKGFSGEASLMRSQMLKAQARHQLGSYTSVLNSHGHAKSEQAKVGQQQQNQKEKKLVQLPQQPEIKKQEEGEGEGQKEDEKEEKKNVKEEEAKVENSKNNDKTTTAMTMVTSTSIEFIVYLKDKPGKNEPPAPGPEVIVFLFGINDPQTMELSSQQELDTRIDKLKERFHGFKRDLRIICDFLTSLGY